MLFLQKPIELLIFREGRAPPSESAHCYRYLYSRKRGVMEGSHFSLCDVTVTIMGHYGAV